MHPPLSIRERQRAETLKLLHQAAVDLVGDGGLAGATVDAITAQAGVSRRTFFNYYASKEDAVLGTTAPVIPDDALAEFFDDDSRVDQFTRTLRLISATIQSTREQDRIDMATFRQLVVQFPELRARVQQHAAAAERLVEDALTEHFSKDADSTRAADSARALLLLASAVMRFAYSRDPGAIAAPDGETVASAIAVFQDALAGAARRI